MANGLLITDYLWYGSGAPSGAPSLASGSQYAIYQDIVAGAMYYWDLDTTAWVQIPELDGSGHIPLSELAGITTSQLSATAGIVAGQIASVNPSALTGSGTVPAAALPKASNVAFGAVEGDGTTITIVAGVASTVAGGGGGVTVSEAVLSSNVSLSSAQTWYNVLSLLLAAGTYLLFADVDFEGDSSLPQAVIKIWDGTNPAVAGAGQVAGGGYETHLSITGKLLVVPTTTTYYLAAWIYGGAWSVSTDTANTSVNNLATHFTALKIA